MTRPASLLPAFLSVACLLTALPVQAGLPDDNPYDSAQAQRAAPMGPSYPYANPPYVGTAYAWTLGGTVLPVLAGITMLGSGSSGGAFLFLAGLIAGPSSGQYYAGSPWQATSAMEARGTGILLIAREVSNALDERTCRNDESDSGKDLDCSEGSGLLLAGGLVLLVGGTFYSLFDTGYAVSRAQWDMAAKRGAALRVEPMLAWTGTSTAAGARASLSF